MSQPQEPKARKVRRYSIFWALAVLMVLLCVVPLFYYSQKAIRTSKDFIEDSLRERQLFTSSPATKQVQTMMLGYARHLMDLRDVFEVSSADKDVRIAHESLLAGGILDRFLSDDCLCLVYLDAEGNQLATTLPGLRPSEADTVRAQAIQMGRTTPHPDGRPAGSKVFFLTVTTLGGISTPAIAMNIAVRKADTPAATLAAVFHLGKVQSSVANFTRDLTLFVTDARGSLIFHSDPSLAGRPEDLSDNPVVSRVISAGNYPENPTNTNVSVREDGVKKTYLVTYAPLQMMDYRWILYSQADRGLYLSPVKALETQSALWIAILIFLSMAASFFTARIITKPILDMTEVARKLADQDFSTRANEGYRNEVGDLARAFNKMAKDIQVYIQRVEAKAEEHRRLFLNSIRAFAQAIDAKDTYTRGHSERVSAYSMVIAREYPLDARDLQSVLVASLLHDVGKIGIKDEVLLKPGALNDEEFARMKEHPAKGAEILSSIPELEKMIPGIRHHHERWGGGGYPDGLKGEDVPLVARIVGVADAFDAMTTNRPYQVAMDFSKAAARVNELMGTVYEPRVVEAFNRAFQNGAFQRAQATANAQAQPRPQTKPPK